MNWKTKEIAVETDFEKKKKLDQQKLTPHKNKTKQNKTTKKQTKTKQMKKPKEFH